MTDFEKKIEEFVVQLWDVGGIKFGQYVLKSGITSPIYLDLRVIVSHPKLMVMISELVTELMEMKNVKPDTICGVPYTALPIATLVSTSTGIPMVMRRKEQKAYGTGLVIEGKFIAGASCTIIEDVISTGSSILETAKDVENAGLRVLDAVVVVDREHGALDHLERSSIRTHVLVPLSQILAVLYCRGHITQQIVANVKTFIAQSQISSNGSITDGRTHVNRLKTSLANRAESAMHSVAKRLFTLMEEKQSLLCVAVDVETSAELLAVADEVGPHVAVVKTHADAVTDFTTNTADSLLQLAAKHNFLIMEDRKFADIGNTVRLQYSTTVKWAHLVTAHSLVGPGVLEGIRRARGSYDRGVFLLAEASASGALTNKAYAKETIKMATDAQDVVVGVVCQSGDLLQQPGILQLTPGVRLSGSEDGLGQQYVDCRTAVVEKGADLAVVGRGILESDDRAEAAKQYKVELWKAYQERIN